MICSSPELQKQETQHLKLVFHEKNDYPKWVINYVVEQVEAKHRTVTHSNNLPMDNFEQLSATNEEKKGHPFSTYAKFSEKLTFLTP